LLDAGHRRAGETRPCWHSTSPSRPTSGGGLAGLSGTRTTGGPGDRAERQQTSRRRFQTAP
jgi:hypothetical protein